MTYISELYDSFMSKISDYSFLDPNLMEDEINEVLFGYFKSARTRFYKCKQRLDLLEDPMTSEQYFGYVDEKGQEVTVTLTGYEIEILSSLMLVEYLKPQVLSSEVLKQSLSDKDFRIYSQANQLRELNLLYRLLQKEATKMITEYSYMGMTDNDK
jgi:hypothetical protein